MVRVASHEGARQSGLVLGASEQPSGHDEQLGQFFQQMRAATGLPPLMIAARLGIDQTVLMALEGGQVLALPDWPETVRFVTAYGRLAGFDPNPVLHRIRAQRMTGGAAVPMPAPVQAAGAHPSTARRSAGREFRAPAKPRQAAGHA